MFKGHKSRYSKNENLLVPVVVSIVGSSVILLVMLSLCSFIALSMDIPISYITPLATLSISVATFVSAAIFSGFFGKNGLITGAIIGLVTFALLLIIALLYDLSTFTGTGTIKLLLLILSGAFGGYCGIMIREGLSRRKK